MSLWLLDPPSAQLLPTPFTSHPTYLRKNADMRKGLQNMCHRTLIVPDILIDSLQTGKKSISSRINNMHSDLLKSK